MTMAPVAKAQAAAGPMAPPASVPPGEVSSQPAPAAKASKPVVKPRTTLAGDWVLNRDQSDDPRAKVRRAEDESSGDPFPRQRTGYPGGGYPPYGYPGGYPPGYPGGGRPTPTYSGKDISGNPKMQPYIHPSTQLSVELKNSSSAAAPTGGAPPEIDFTDDDFNHLILYTDGRKLQKQTDESRVEVAARWNGAQLITDEKSPLGGKLNRTFELSPDGRQLYETIHIDNGKSAPIVIRYVYDASADSTPPSDQSDPNAPVLKRNSTESDD